MQNKSTYFILLFFCMIIPLLSFSQGKVTVSGKVFDAETQMPIPYANIAFPELSMGTSSNKNGEFTIRGVPAGKNWFQVTYIGYKEYKLEMTLNKDVELKVRLQQLSLGLKEVRVTAENSTSGVTSSKIQSEAISHVQASSLKEIMQLVPGNLSENPNLAEPAKISIREIGTDINSALGTAVIVDNIPFSNDGNMQKSIQQGFSSVAGTGIDLRQIAVENIESVSVDVGIPSAEHGNLTSGAVHIKTKSGGSPYQVKLQADPRTKQAYLGKGYLLDNDLGVVNADLGYTNSFGHLTKQTDQFKRINVSTKYAKTFFRGKSPLNLDVKLDYVSSLDGKKWDPDMLAQEEHFAKDQDINGKLSALWSVNRTFMKSISFDFGYSKTLQKGFEKKLESSSSGPNFFSTATTNGEFEVFYGPASYYSEVTYDGKPFDVYSKIKARFYKKSEKTSHNILLGAEWRTTGNNGEGRIFNVNKPPAGTGTRPRPFTDIPSLNQLSAFAEDKVDVKLGNTSLNVMAGIRMDNIQPTGIFGTSGSINFDPRINIRYDIIDRNRNYFLQNFALRLGYGQTTKAPTLIHLYPDKEYNDAISFNYYPNLMVTTTSVVDDTRNPDLKPSKSNKYEAGFDIQINKVKARITGFYEKHTGGFVTDRIYYPMFYRDYDVLPAGFQPYFVEGEGIFYKNPETADNVALGYENDEKFVSYSRFQNANTRIKKGLEYTFDFGKIEKIRTSFVVNGAWMQTETYETDAPYWESIHYTVYSGNTSKQESFAVKFQNKNGYGTVFERLNSNLNIITHIPEIKMLVTLTTQMVWYEKDWRKTYNDYKMYSLSELREYLQLPNLFPYENEDDFYYYLPVCYKNYDNIEKVYNNSDFAENLAQQAIDKNYKYRFAALKLPPLYLCNIKISKDISKRFKLSFYANNFLNVRPWVLDERSGRYLRRNQQPYFGADIKMQF